MKVGIIGVGLIGGSIAASLQVPEVELFLDDANPDVREALSRRHFGEVSSWRDWIGQVEKLVVSVPSHGMPGLIDEVASLMADNAVLMEISSLKRPIAPALTRASKKVTVLSLHLMAGKEVSGLPASQADLFEDCNVALVDVGAGIPDFAEIRWWQERLKFGAFSVWTVDEHDKAVAWVSQLPYLVSRAVRETVESHNPGAVGLAGPGYRDTCRVGHSAWEPLAPLFRQNAGALDEALSAMEAEIHRWRALLHNGVNIL